MKKIGKNWLVLGVIGIVLLVTGIILLVWPDAHDMAQEWIGYFIGVALIAYGVLFLLPNILKKCGLAVKVYMILEIVAVAILSILAFTEKFNSFMTINRILGLVIYIRGVVELIRGYYNNGDIVKIQRDKDGNKVDVYDHALKYITIVLLTLGTWLFFYSKIDDSKVIYGIGILFIVVGAVCVFFGYKIHHEAKKELIELGKAIKSGELVASEPTPLDKKEQKKQNKIAKIKAKQEALEKKVSSVENEEVK